MKWTELDNKERVRFILEYVMGYFILQETAKGWNTPEHPRGHDAVTIGFHWPIAFWNTDGECWMTRDIATDPIIFNPLRDMNDAWKIIDHLNLPFDITRYATPDTPIEPVAYYAVFNVKTNSANYEDHYRTATARTAQEAICLAGLRCRIEIEEVKR